MERRNSGKVLRFDSGLVAVDDGLFEKPAKFDKGVVIAFRKIRRIRVLTKPPAETQRRPDAAPCGRRCSTTAMPSSRT